MLRRSLALLALAMAVLGCGPKVQEQVKRERTRTATRNEFRVEIDDRATMHVVGICEELVKTGCLEMARPKCRELLIREIGSCSELTLSEVEESLDAKQCTRWTTYFDDCVFEAVRSLVDMERPECKRAIR